LLWGDGTPTREFFYVEDCADGLIAAIERYDSSDPVNLGSGEGDLDRGSRAQDGEARRFRWKVVWDTTKPNVSLAAGWT